MTKPCLEWEKIKAVTDQYPVANVRMFDTGFEGEFGILVEALPTATLFDLGGLKEDLETLLNSPVQLVTPPELPKRIRDSVIASAKPLSTDDSWDDWFNGDGSSEDFMPYREQPSERKRRYRLDDLVRQCDPNAPYPDELREWDEAPEVGREAGSSDEGITQLRGIIRSGQTVGVDEMNGAIRGRASRRLALPFTEADLLEGLDGHTVHADERAEPLAYEIDPQEALKGSVFSYIDPMEPAAGAEEWEVFSLDSGGSSEDQSKRR